jgi:hypothetical protein
MYPEIFSADEQRERFRFHIFYNQAFITKKGSSQHFYTGLTADLLLSMFRTMYPDTSLTLDIVQHILRFGGYFDNPTGLVYCNINEMSFSALPPKTQQRILDYSNYANTLSFRQKLLGHDIVVSDFGVIIDVGLRLFLSNVIFQQKNFKYFNMIPKSFNKVSQYALYSLYQSFCYKQGYKPMSKHFFAEALVKKGCRKAKGYYMGTSGVNVFDNIFAPWTEEDMQWSIEEGVGVITLDKKQIFNDGRLVANFTEDGLTAYLNSRKEFRKGNEDYKREETFKEEREETEFEDSDDDGGEDQDREDDSPGGEEKSGARGKLPNGIGIAEVWYDEFTSGDTLDRFKLAEERDEPADDSEDGFNPTEHEDRYPVFIAPAACRTDVTDTTAIVDGVPGESETPTIAELTAAMRVPYKMNPTKFTKEEMKGYLQVIDPTLDVESYWDVIMSILTIE